MKKLLYLLVFIIILSLFRADAYAEESTKIYEHTMKDLCVAERHDISECRFEQFVGDELFFWTVKEGESWIFEKVEFYLIDLSNDCKETKIPFSLEDTFVTDVSYTGQYIYILYHDKDDRQCILKIDKEGKTIADFMLKDIESGQTVYDIHPKADGTVLASGRLGAAEFDKDGNKVWIVERSRGFYDSAYDGKDRLFCRDTGGFYEIDVNSGKLIHIETSADYLYARLFASDGKAYINFGDRIKEYDGDWDNLKQKLFFYDYGLFGYTEAFSAEKDLIRFIDYDVFNPHTEVMLHTIDFSKEGKKKQEILLLFPEYMPFPGEMFDIFGYYNRFSPDYYLLYSTYKSDEELGAFYADVRPDIVMMPDKEIRKHTDLVLDILPLMKKSNSLTPDSLLPAVKRNYTEGGAMYMLPIELSLETYVVRQSDYEKTGFATDDYLAYLKRDGKLYTDYFLSKESAMKAVLETELGRFVNYDKKTCSFNSEEFKQLVQKIDGLYSDNYFYADVELAPFTADDRILDDARISNFNFFSLKRKALGGAVTAVGRPSAKSGKAVMSALCLAITTDSSCPEEAFDFLEYYSNHFTGVDREGTILANKEQLEISLEKLRSRLAVNDYLFEKTTLISSKDIDIVMEAIDNSVVPKSGDREVMEYVTYYTDKYFNGEMTLKEATNELQKTVTGYLKGNR
ncbi:MAG: hypothetical protein K6G72_06610 [Lachnospiraceae bacterium]|nr:hypothetical protein [Lachnospiraceae bacterium]